MLNEKDRLTDSLITQKYIASGYNLAAAESANSQLMDAFIGILRDEHQIHHEIFNEMSNRGWYQPKAANMNDIGQHMTKWNQELQRVQTTAFRQPGAQQAGYPMGAQQAGYQTGAQQSGYPAGIPQYGFQTGVGLPQMGNEAQQQTMYRPPQNPMI